MQCDDPGLVVHFRTCNVYVDLRLIMTLGIFINAFLMHQETRNTRMIPSTNDGMAS